MTLRAPSRRVVVITSGKNARMRAIGDAAVVANASNRCNDAAQRCPSHRAISPLVASRSRHILQTFDFFLPKDLPLRGSGTPAGGGREFSGGWKKFSGGGRSFRRWKEVSSRRKAYSFPGKIYASKRRTMRVRAHFSYLYLIRRGQSMSLPFQAGTSAQNAGNLTNQTVHSPRS